MNKRWNVRMLVEGGMMIALSTLLSYITIYEAPQGGSVSAGSMIPIMLFAIRWGLGPGFAVGTTYGILHFILKPSFYHPMQFIFDYPLAYGLLGLAGIGHIMKNRGEVKNLLNTILGVVLAIVGRSISHILSGVIFFSEYAGDMNPWLYSIIYNATYLIPELLISILVMVLIWKPLSRIIKTS